MELASIHSAQTHLTYLCCKDTPKCQLCQLPCAIIPDLQGNGTEESDMDATDEIEVRFLLKMTAQVL
jgi:hypothetical protein